VADRSHLSRIGLAEPNPLRGCSRTSRPSRQGISTSRPLVASRTSRSPWDLAIRVVYRSPERTLTDAEVDAAHANVVAAAAARFGATLRA
jgi:hypothetical protein